MQLKPTLSQLCLILHNDILEELIRVSLTVIVNINKYERKLQKSTQTRNKNKTRILNYCINKAAQEAGALYHQSSTKSSSRSTQRVQRNVVFFIKGK